MKVMIKFRFSRKVQFTEAEGRAPKETFILHISPIQSCIVKYL